MVPGYCSEPMYILATHLVLSAANLSAVTSDPGPPWWRREVAVTVVVMVVLVVLVVLVMVVVVVLVVAAAWVRIRVGYCDLGC